MTRYWLTFVPLLLAPLLCAQEGTSGFYLLRTGSVLEGTASFDGKHYVVQTQFGTMSVPLQSVEFVGKSKMDVYLHKRNSVDPTDYNALVRLAEWCAGNGYTEESIAEYQRAGQVAPNAVFAGIVQQRLDTLRQVGAASPIQELLRPQSDVPQERLGVNSPVYAEIPVSRQTFESYVRWVQPHLVNRCIAADCHGTHGERQFKLGVPQESMGSTSRRNLQAVLQYIDHNAPTESAVLSALTTPHGGAKTPLNVESNLYVQIAQWVQQVAKELPPDRRNETIKVSVLPEQFRRAISQAERQEPSKESQQRGVDPLDPAVFNERYHRGMR